jgi:hypothetical protein
LDPETSSPKAAGHTKLLWVPIKCETK